MNCILSNPYHRAKVVETSLFNNRMNKIDKDIRLNYFVGLYLKTFPISNVCLYGQPVVTRCEITINRDDIMMEHAVQDFKKIFMVDNDQLEINYSEINGRRNEDTSSPWTSDTVACQVMYKYEQMFPCSFVLNMFNDDNVSFGGKKVIVVPSVKAKEATKNIVELIIKSIDPSSELVDHHAIMNNYIDCIVDTLDEQNTYLYLPKQAIEFDNTSEVFTSGDSFRGDIVIQKFDTDAVVKEKIIEDQKVVTGCGISTVSGTIKSGNDYFVFTTGHGLAPGSEPINKNYSLKDFIWPSYFRSSQIKDGLFESFVMKNAVNRYPTISDVAVLQPSQDAIGKFYIVNNFVERDFIGEYNKGDPVVPEKTQIKGTVKYVGCKTGGMMQIIGTAYIAFVSSNKIGKETEVVTIYERLYLALPVKGDESSEFDEGGATSAESIKGDSGSCIVMQVTDESIAETARIHSFLKGKMKNNNYRLLSPAHFVLEQMRKIVKKPDAVFVTFSPSSSVIKPKQELIISIDDISSKFANGRKDTLQHQNKVEISQPEIKSKVDKSNQTINECQVGNKMQQKKISVCSIT